MSIATDPVSRTSTPPPSLRTSTDLVDNTSENEIKRLTRTYTTDDGAPVKAIDVPAPVAARRKTFSKDASIDKVISPPTSLAAVKPVKSQLLQPIASRPPSPLRAATSPASASASCLSAKEDSLLPSLHPSLSLFPSHLATRERSILLDSRLVSSFDRDGRQIRVLFYIGTRHFRDADGTALFGLRRRRLLWRQWELSIPASDGRERGRKLRLKSGRTGECIRTRFRASSGASAGKDYDAGRIHLVLDGEGKMSVTRGAGEQVVAEVERQAQAGGWKIRVTQGFDLPMACAMVLAREMARR